MNELCMAQRAASEGGDVVYCTKPKDHVAQGDKEHVATVGPWGEGSFPIATWTDKERKRA